MVANTETVYTFADNEIVGQVIQNNKEIKHIAE